MFCSKCGAEVEDGMIFCPSCGKDLRSGSTSSYNGNSDTPNKAALVGFVFSFFMPLVGLILGIVGIVNSKERGRKGYAIAAICISVGFMILNFILRMFVLEWLEEWLELIFDELEGMCNVL